MNKGKFITFEGGDGAGKSTQIEKFADYLRSQGKDVIITKEPGATTEGKVIRKLLLEGDANKFDLITELLLFYADRRLNISKVILPALAMGKYVISDRRNDSTVAYQFYGHQKLQDRTIIDNLYDIVAQDCKPDMTFYLDIDVEIGLQRSFAKASELVDKEIRFESIDKSFHHRLRQGFLDMVKAEPNRFIQINANNNIEDVTKEIIKAYHKYIGE